MFDLMLPYPSVLTVQELSLLLLGIMTVLPGPPMPRLLVSAFIPPSPSDIFSMLRLISPITAVWPRLGMLGTRGASLFLILLARLFVRKLDSPNSPPTPMAAATAISRSASFSGTSQSPASRASLVVLTLLSLMGKVS